MRRALSLILLTVLVITDPTTLYAMIPPNHEISVDSIPGATGQLETFLKWVLKENKKTEGTFFISRLKLKDTCKPVKVRGIQPDDDERLRALYEDQLELDMDCLSEQPYILWSEGNMLFRPVFISWRLAGTLPEGSSLHEAIRLHIPPHNFIDLNEDVVPTEKDIGGSTYLVTRAWVHKRMRDALNGDERVVKLGPKD